ncbi:MAG: tRNA 2-selenouridine(34) synthase MnmH [Bacteroidales bacterium]|nr:tRNA 2-selenouridine(34) synthase MnmH [Bacteroidales bacterium]
MRILKTKEFLEQATTIIDVRSPSEYIQGHIPGAVNVPIFNDDERALVGIRYKNSGKDSAVLLGLEIVGPKMAGFVKQVRKISLQKKIHLHCWRGGMRSKSMAWLFETSGLEVDILEDGYKAYRSYIRSDFDNPAPIIILSGMTGSGKTDVLHALEKLGEQIIDLEGIANHKGSAFGAMGQDPQPTNEQFENDIAFLWQKLDFNKPVWVEDESRAIGTNSIPEPLFFQMRKAPVLRIEILKEHRIVRLINEYACFEKDELEKAIIRIGKRLGGQHVKRAVQALEKDDFAMVADITLDYYDKAYIDGLVNRRSSEFIQNVKVDEDNPMKTAQTLIQLGKDVNFDLQ